MMPPLVLRSVFARHCWVVAMLIALGVPVLSGRGGTKVTVTTNYYTISGNSIRELHASQVRERPWKARYSFTARTTWNIKWHFRAKRQQDGYRVERFESQVKVLMVMPRWIPPKDVDGHLLQSWKRYSQALHVHEQGHLQIARQAAAALELRINALGALDSSSALRTAIQGSVDRTVKEHTAKEKEYDRRTRHGVTQGAELRW